MSDRGFPSMTALLGLLAIAGFQNRDKIAEMIRNATGGGEQDNPNAAPPTAPGTASDTGGFGGGLGGMLGGGGLGGLLGGLGGMLGGTAGSANSGAVVQDGLTEILNRFQQNGHGDTAASWVGTGENRNIDDQSLEQAIGPDVIDTLAQKTGLSREDLLARLSRALPQAVDALTPNGRIGA
ncbi:YidB family protein [Ancylobacter sp. 6x-1]|uniref:YidB family protein n=1 Tax=Ancylobacter crimeensis TaxID=2579147 RepID=A0ABT0DFX5_9HYPH|nr:YidB family protein [Ancylobacter crimeensis]MCK0198870.1 YidB family protein [Ancylobacter crimeensis]